MPDPRYESIYTGQQVETAIGRALPLDDFALATDEIISGVVYHVLWKVAPTNANTVSGIAVHPNTGKWYSVTSVNGTKSINKYLSEEDNIIDTEIDDILDDGLLNNSVSNS